jgi:3-deoxy-manno-octulosonate cytidylyltransferase (CMP-KDO synthetase)
MIFIPARLDSTRLSGKLLLADTGMPIICHTVAAALRVRGVDKVVVVTNSDEIEQAVAGRCSVFRSQRPHQNGTSRVAEAAEAYAMTLAGDLVINLQADEPTICPGDLELLIEVMRLQSEWKIGTLATTLAEEDHDNPSCVKIVTSSWRALYFSRTFLPGSFRHVGVYCFRGDHLRDRVMLLGPTYLCDAERLEQMAFLEQGWPILAVPAAPTIGIDTREDYVKFCEWNRSRD